jgi:hypothetical protein
MGEHTPSLGCCNASRDDPAASIGLIPEIDDITIGIHRLQIGDAHEHPRREAVLTVLGERQIGGDIDSRMSDLPLTVLEQQHVSANARLGDRIEVLI